ncbi:hypothetical protein VTL71DRAFT_13917 [Oculimacula yallundae]|uniref:Uncharacterized protein n=1 Tax=Oculimacula yallundae TaxID=86028 RepID=A0ABR4CNU8_9HELO
MNIQAPKARQRTGHHGSTDADADMGNSKIIMQKKAKERFRRLDTQYILHLSNTITGGIVYMRIISYNSASRINCCSLESKCFLPIINTCAMLIMTKHILR